MPSSVYVCMSVSVPVSLYVYTSMSASGVFSSLNIRRMSQKLLAPADARVHAPSHPRHLFFLSTFQGELDYSTPGVPGVF